SGGGGSGGGGSGGGGGAGVGGPGGSGAGGPGGSGAGAGGRGGNTGAGGGSGDDANPLPVHNVCQGRPFTLHGVIIEIIGPRAGRGFLLRSGDKVTKIYGTGPAGFWQAQGIAPLSVGQHVTVDGFKVNYNGIKRSLAARLHLPKGVVVLRSDKDCLPVWRRFIARRDQEQTASPK
ncbi:hypothetical protein, partial [Dethiosulfatarculus sandiegensis]|uniref:hypothetical protein n=1 Tax=Dethiosulfatarculus sandiegensis TaxID=1429043 RepID=UPI0005CB5B67